MERKLSKSPKRNVVTSPPQARKRPVKLAPKPMKVVSREVEKENEEYDPFVHAGNSSVCHADIDGRVKPVSIHDIMTANKQRVTESFSDSVVDSAPELDLSKVSDVKIILESKLAELSHTARTTLMLALSDPHIMNMSNEAIAYAKSHMEELKRLCRYPDAQLEQLRIQAKGTHSTIYVDALDKFFRSYDAFWDLVHCLREKQPKDKVRIFGGKTRVSLLQSFYELCSIVRNDVLMFTKAQVELRKKNEAFEPTKPLSSMQFGKKDATLKARDLIAMKPKVKVSFHRAGFVIVSSESSQYGSVQHAIPMHGCIVTGVGKSELDRYVKDSASKSSPPLVGSIGCYIPMCPFYFPKTFQQYQDFLIAVYIVSGGKCTHLFDLDKLFKIDPKISAEVETADVMLNKVVTIKLPKLVQGPLKAKLQYTFATDTKKIASTAGDFIVVPGYAEGEKVKVVCYGSAIVSLVPTRAEFTGTTLHPGVVIKGMFLGAAVHGLFYLEEDVLKKMSSVLPVNSWFETGLSGRLVGEDLPTFDADPSIILQENQNVFSSFSTTDDDEIEKVKEEEEDEANEDESYGFAFVVDECMCSMAYTGGTDIEKIQKLCNAASLAVTVESCDGETLRISTSSYGVRHCSSGVRGGLIPLEYNVKSQEKCSTPNCEEAGIWVGDGVAYCGDCVNDEIEFTIDKNTTACFKCQCEDGKWGDVDNSDLIVDESASDESDDDEVHSNVREATTSNSDNLEIPEVSSPLN